MVSHYSTRPGRVTDSAWSCTLSGQRRRLPSGNNARPASISLLPAAEQQEWRRMSGHDKGRTESAWPAKDRRSRFSRRFAEKLNSDSYLTVRHTKEKGTPSAGLVLGRRRWVRGNLGRAATGRRHGSRRRRPEDEGGRERKRRVEEREKPGK